MTVAASIMPSALHEPPGSGGYRGIILKTPSFPYSHMTQHLPATALPYDYTRIEHIVAGYTESWRHSNFDAVVAIARGGLVPGVMVSTALDIPLYAVGYDRARRHVSWFSVSRPKRNARVLVVEDIAGRGTTLSDSLSFLQGYGLQTQVFTLAYDAESRITPDFGIELAQGYRAWFPWERESITPAFDVTANRPAAREYTYASWAIDLDGVLLPDLPEHMYAQALEDTLAQRDTLLPSTTLPDLDLATVTIITGRPEQDRVRTQNWLTSHGFHGPLVMRDPSRYDVDQTALHKAAALLQRRHTHFLESDVEQALEISHHTQVARVFWWNGQHARLVHASPAQVLQSV